MTNRNTHYPAAALALRIRDRIDSYYPANSPSDLIQTARTEFFRILRYSYNELDPDNDYDLDVG